VRTAIAHRTLGFREARSVLAARSVPVADRVTRWAPVVAVVAVVAVAVILVGPALLDPTGRVAGEQGDPSAAVWQLHELDTGHLGLLSPTTTPSANAPSGAELRRPIEVSTAAFDALSLVISKVTGAVLAYNLLLVLAVVTNGLAMLVLARRLRLGSAGATVAAVAFAAAPPLVVELHLHAALAFAATIPLAAAFGVGMVDDEGARPALLAGLVTGVAVYVNPYLPLYTGVVLGSCCIAALGVRGVRAIRSVVVAVAVAGVVALPAALTVLLNRAEVIASTRRTLAEVATFSLHARDYVTAFGSGWWIVLVAAVASCGVPTLRERTRAWWAFLVIAVVGWLLTIGPDAHVAGIEVRTPSAWLFDLFPVWRVIGRASVLVWFVVALLIGAATTWCTSSVRSGPVHSGLARSGLVRAFGVGVVAVTCAAWLGGAFDRGQPWFPSETDPSLTALLAATPGRVAEYPLWGFDNAIGPYLLRQMHHGRELLNGGIVGSLSATLASVAGDPQDPQATRALAVAGVTRVAAQPGAGVPSGLTEVGRSERGARAYDVPRPLRPAVAIAYGAYPPERPQGSQPFRWMGSRGGLRVIGARPGRYTVAFDAWSPGGSPRALLVSGRVVTTITGTPQRVSLCVGTGEERGGLSTRTVTLRTAEAPARLGPSDPRHASLAIRGESAVTGCPA
jgi:hypothetical protein